MLTGSTIDLRLVREGDVDFLWQKHVDIANRGAYYPIGVMSEPRWRQRYNENGFWSPDDGTLVIVDKQDTIVGHIEYFPTVAYLDELEIGYQIYDTENRGKGYMSEAVQLLTRYLFERKKHNRIRLIIHPDNAASRRVAEKCGYQYEGIMRGAWYNRGKNHDVAVYAVLRDEILGDGG
jgi:[ribosomal protein S5]-alanine N-acetyltransferase